MFIKKLISGLIIASLIVAAEWFSPFIWFLALCGISVIGNHELQKMAEEKKYRHSYKLITFFIILFLSVAYVSANVQLNNPDISENFRLLLSPENYKVSPIEWKTSISNSVASLQNLILGTAFILLTIVNLSYKPRVSIGEISFSFIRILYLGFFPSFMILLRALPNGAEILLGVLVSGSFSDMFAYFTGKSIGKTPFVQEISPNKTLEGAFGGAIACILCFMLFGIFLAKIAWFHALIIGIMVAIIAPMGDLVESLFKRDAGQKDSGSFIPGHGGALDRIDSYIFTSFPVYFYVLYFVY